MVRQTSAAIWIQCLIMCQLDFDVRARNSVHRHFYIYILMLDCTLSEFIVKRVSFIVPCTRLFESTFTLLLTGRCCFHCYTVTYVELICS